MIYEYFEVDPPEGQAPRVLAVEGSIKSPPPIGEKLERDGVVYERGFSLPPPPKIKNWHIVANSLPRVPNATPEQLADWGIPRVDRRGAPVFTSRREVLEYKAKNSNLAAGNVDYDGSL